MLAGINLPFGKASELREVLAGGLRPRDRAPSLLALAGLLLWSSTCRTALTSAVQCKARVEWWHCARVRQRCPTAFRGTVFGKRRKNEGPGMKADTMPAYGTNLVVVAQGPLVNSTEKYDP